MNTEIRFRSGQPMDFRATRDFGLPTGQKIHFGDLISYDGNKAEIDGDEIVTTHLRGAVKVGWLVLAENYDEEDPTYGLPASANIQVRPPDGGNPLNAVQKTSISTVSEDERDVGTVKAVTAATRQANAVAAQGRRPRPQAGSAEDQDGVVVSRTIKTAAKQKSVLSGSNTSVLISQAEQNSKIEPGKGITEDEMLARMSPDERDAYLAQKETLRGQYVEEAAPAPRKKVATVPKRKAQVQAEGMTITTTTGGGTEVADLSGSSGEATVTKVEQEGITFTQTNGAKGPGARTKVVHVDAPPAMVDARRSVAKAVCPDFPDAYDFSVPARKRVARLQADFDDRPDVIRAAFAAETDDVKALIHQTFPEAFG